MTALFAIASAVAVLATAMVVTRRDPVHALLYLVVSVLALAVDFWLLGAPIVAGLEVVIYAGAILVLFVFVVLLLGERAAPSAAEIALPPPAAWLGPSALALILLGELAWLAEQQASPLAQRWVGPEIVGRALWGPYAIAVEAASFLLLAALIGAWHLARPEGKR